MLGLLVLMDLAINVSECLSFSFLLTHPDVAVFKGRLRVLTVGGRRSPRCAGVSLALLDKLLRLRLGSMSLMPLLCSGGNQWRKRPKHFKHLESTSPWT